LKLQLALRAFYKDVKYKKTPDDKAVVRRKYTRLGSVESKTCIFYNPFSRATRTKQSVRLFSGLDIDIKQ